MGAIKLDFLLFQTVDQETILNILDDRDAFLELERTNVGQQTRFKDQIKFFNQAEKWLTTNAKRYSDPVKFVMAARWSQSIPCRRPRPRPNPIKPKPISSKNVRDFSKNISKKYEEKCIFKKANFDPQGFV